MLLLPGVSTMEKMSKPQSIVKATIAFLMIIHSSRAQMFNYTTAVSGWDFGSYPSAQARSPSRSFLQVYNAISQFAVFICLTTRRGSD